MVIIILGTSSEIPLHIEENEAWTYIEFFMRLFHLYNSPNIRGITKHAMEMDWETKSVGSFFIKNLRPNFLLSRNFELNYGTRVSCNKKWLGNPGMVV